MELLLSICLVASPGTCREETVSVGLEAPAAPTRCLLEAPMIIAEWTGTHPKWQVIKWRCVRPRAGRDI